MRKHITGEVNGTKFKNGRKMVYLIYKTFYEKNPNISLNELMGKLDSYNLIKFNDINERSFFKSEFSYNKLDDRKKKKFYDPNPFLFDKNKYYLKTETQEKENIEHIRFAKDNGIDVKVYGNPVTSILKTPIILNPDVIKLKKNNDNLLSFYVAETRSVLTKEQFESLNNMNVSINEEKVIYYEIVGRYDLRGIIEELKSILETDNLSNESKLMELIMVLINLLISLLEIESIYFNQNNREILQCSNNYPFISIEKHNDILNKSEEILKNIKGIIERVKKILKSRGVHNKRIEDILKKIIDDIFPKIIGRKRPNGILGSFHADDFSITLYKTAIENWLKDVDYFKKLIDVYSHEFFHAYHFLHMENPNLWEYDNESRIVKESLARYIEYKYGIFNIAETKISSDLIRVWNDYNMLDFPYAGAKFVNQYIGLCELLFKESALKGTLKSFYLIESTYKLNN